MSLHLFEAFGVELEYMIVDRRSLAVRPLCDQVLLAAQQSRDVAQVSPGPRAASALAAGHEGSPPAVATADKPPPEVAMGALSWSNELVNHVIELKTHGPAPSLRGLAELFQRDVQRINALLAPHDAMLMPTAMHPWMDPLRETVLWPHGYSAVYQAFDRIFGCRGHGWANLQSTHLNVPFAGDDEFGRLHAAIRLALPLLPALAASSPIVEGKLTGYDDTRLEVYRTNARRIPSVTGRVIPEPAGSQQEYHDRILAPMYRDIAAHDRDGILQHEWLNARGAIARFDRSTIEIRVLDLQERPAADLAILELIVATLRALVEERWAPYRAQAAWPIEPLERVLLATIRSSDQALIDDGEYLRMFGLPARPCLAGDVWRELGGRLLGEGSSTQAGDAALREVFAHGTLARRLRAACGGGPTPERLRDISKRLCAQLAPVIESAASP